MTVQRIAATAAFLRRESTLSRLLQRMDELFITQESPERVCRRMASICPLVSAVVKYSCQLFGDQRLLHSSMLRLSSGFCEILLLSSKPAHYDYPAMAKSGGSSRKLKSLLEPHPKPVNALEYPRFAGISTFMRLPHISDAMRLDVALIGIPFDGGTSYRTGARFGPRNIRQQSAIIRPYHPVLDVSPFDVVRAADYGDLPVNPLSIDDTFAKITAGLKPVLDAGTIPMCVGGDHSILLPILRAVHAKHGPVALIQLDAHSDTWDEYWGMKYSHGTPVRRAIEEGLLDESHILQVGLRGQLYDSHDMDFAQEHGIGTVTAEAFHERGLATIRKKLQAFKGCKTYLTLDIDVVDPAFAPGTGTPQVGGLSSVQILDLVRAFAGLNFVGCDLVEVAPQYDSSEITSLLAANLLFEQLCLLCKNGKGRLQDLNLVSSH